MGAHGSCPWNILNAYDTMIHGFSMQLTKREAQDMAGMHGENPRYQPGDEVRTAHHGGNDGLFPQSGTAGDIVVGVLDTGVWLESKNYDDARLGEVPSW